MTMATILLVGVDLMVRSRLDVLLAGHRLVTSDSADAPDLVICDIARVDADEVADAWPETRTRPGCSVRTPQGSTRCSSAPRSRSGRARWSTSSSASTLDPVSHRVPLVGSASE